MMGQQYLNTLNFRSSVHHHQARDQRSKHKVTQDKSGQNQVHRYYINITSDISLGELIIIPIENQQFRGLQQVSRPVPGPLCSGC